MFFAVFIPKIAKSQGQRPHYFSHSYKSIPRVSEKCPFTRTHSSLSESILKQ